MFCFNCSRSKEEVVLFQLPVTFLYEGVHMQVLGNCKPNELMCLPCIGYQYDLIEEERIKAG
jgi:hypothetical protein